MKNRICRCVLLAGVACFVVLHSCSTDQTYVVDSIDNVPIWFDVYGEGTPTLVLVHGWGNNRTYWEPHLPYFSARYQVVTIDLAGFGESGDGREEWTMEAFGNDVTAVVESLDLRDVVLVGFSMGGPAALEAATQMPDRVLGIVLVDALTQIESQFIPEQIDAEIAGFLQNRHDPAFIRRILFSPDTEDRLVQRYMDSHPDVIPEYWWESLKQLDLWKSRDAKSTLLEINAPIIAINRGRPDVEAIRQYVPSYEVKYMPDVGHIGVIWDMTDLFDRLLDDCVEEFIRQNEAPGG